MLSRNNSVPQFCVNNTKTTCIQSNMIQYIYWWVNTRDYRTMAATIPKPIHVMDTKSYIISQTTELWLQWNSSSLNSQNITWLHMITQYHSIMMIMQKNICSNINIWCIHEHQQIIVSKGIKEVYKETTQLYITWKYHTDQNTDITYWQNMSEFVGSSLYSDMHQLQNIPVTLHSRLLEESVLFTKHMVNSNDEIQLHHIQICCFTICISTRNIKLMF